MKVEDEKRESLLTARGVMIGLVIALSVEVVGTLIVWSCLTWLH